MQTIRPLAFVVPLSEYICSSLLLVFCLVLTASFAHRMVVRSQGCVSCVLDGVGGGSSLPCFFFDASEMVMECHSLCTQGSDSPSVVVGE